MPKKLYDTLKWVALVLLPAVSVLLGVVLPLWGVGHVTQILLSTTALDVFLGSLVGVHSAIHTANTSAPVRGDTGAMGIPGVPGPPGPAGKDAPPVSLPVLAYQPPFTPPYQPPVPASSAPDMQSLMQVQPQPGPDDPSKTTVSIDRSAGSVVL